MELDFVSLVAAGDDPMAQVLIAKAAPDKSTEPETVPPTISRNDPPKETHVATINKSDLDPEVVAYIDGLETEVETLGAQVEKAEADLTAKDDEITSLNETLSKSSPKDDEAAEEISKALLAKADPAVRALIEKQQADLKQVQAVAKAEREARLEREFVSKAEALPMIAEDKSALAGLLRRISDAMSAEDTAEVEKMLGTANEQIAKGNLFSEFGNSGAETTISKSVKAKADELRKADPTLTEAQAEVLVYEQNPDMAEAAFNGKDA